MKKQVTIFSWDAFSMDVYEYTSHVPVSVLLLTPAQAMIMANDELTQKSGTKHPVYSENIREEDGVFVLDGVLEIERRSGQTQKFATRTYYCPTDPDRAKGLAEKESEA